MPFNTVSDTASELLYFVSSNLILLQNEMSNALFERIVHEIANEMNRILMEDLILKNSFNESGAKQLNYDISMGCLPLFRLYIRKPEFNFVE